MTADLLQQFANLSLEERKLVLEELRAQGIDIPLDTQSQSDDDGVSPTESVTHHRSISIPPRDRIQPIPLSFQQEQLWFLHQLDSSSIAYNERDVLLLQGDLDINALEQAIHTVVCRHEGLRTIFVLDEDKPVIGAADGTKPSDSLNDARQVIQPFDVTVHTLTHQTVSTLGPLTDQMTRNIGRDDVTRGQNILDNMAELREAINGFTYQPFNLNKGPLWRMVLFSADDAADSGAQTYILMVVLHHIIADAWSMATLLQEIASAYTALVQGQTIEKQKIGIHYADFASWQRAEWQAETMASHLDFWCASLADAPLLLQLPTDQPRPSSPSGQGSSYQIHLSHQLTQKLKTLSREANATLYMTLLAAFNILLARYANQNDIVIGSVQANREYPELESTIGHFVNTLAIRTQLAPDCTFQELLAQLCRQIQDSYEHQSLPFQMLVQALQPERTLSYHPIYQVSFNFHNQPGVDSDGFVQAFEGLRATPLAMQSQTSKVDLYLLMIEKQGTLVGEFAYNTDIFDEATIARMASHFTVLLESIVSQLDEPIHQLPMLTEAEYHQIVHEWNDTAFDFGESQTIHALFEQQVERTPDAVALVFEDEQLTYRELNVRANQLAHHLIELGVLSDTLVAVAMERSIEMVVSLLAVLKAGGAYVPIDPTYPEERIRFMLADSAAPILLTQSHLSLAQLIEYGGVEGISRQLTHVIAVDTMTEKWATQSVNNPKTQISVDDLIYVIYTSGSTGQPKGVAIEHGNVFNYLQWCLLRYGVDTGYGTLVHSPLSFDLTVTSIWSPLLIGNRLHLLPENDAIDMLVQSLLHTNNLSLVKLTPAHLQLLNHQLDAQQFKQRTNAFIIGGEALHHSILQPWMHYAPETLLVNEYGPTEATVGCVVYTATPTDRDEWVKIGKPIANTEVYILGQDDSPTPIGIAGELHIGGVQLARGYLNRPDLTAERFIDHPEFGRLYKTGDLCRWLSDGNIEYIGRTDFQVKIRGFRIELGEIENALLAQESVREAVVMAREENGDKRLVAYIIDSGQWTVDSEGAIALRAALQQTLPEYMIPSAFVFLDAMPLTPNGKLDRRALPEPDYKDAQSEFVAPRTETEIVLAEAISHVLRIDQASPEHRRRIGIHDNFFRMGGDSILSIQVVSRAAQQGYTISVKDIFQYPTIAELATKLDTTEAGSQIVASQGTQEGLAPLLPIQRWFLESGQPEMHHFNQAFLLNVKQPIHYAELEQAVGALLQHHDALRFAYGRDESGWQQQYLKTYGDDDSLIPLSVVDLRAIAPAERVTKIEQVGAESQASLDPLCGDLVRFVYFQTDENEGESDRLLIVIHHLAVDGVSWRILIEDLTTLLDGGELPPKTSSYGAWGEALQRATAEGYFDQDINRWLADEQVDHLASLPLDDLHAINRVGNSHHLSLILTQEETEHLLRLLPEQHDVTLDAVVLTALTETLTNGLDQANLRVKFESYGRQELFDTINLNRTIGWFTSAYPITIPRFEGSVVKRIRYTLNQLRRVTDGGISFGALQDFHPDEAVRAKVAALPEPQVVYNYLGQLDSLDNHRFGMASESTGPAFSPLMVRDTLLDSNAMIINGQLHIHWTVTPQIDLERAEALLDRFQQHLCELMQEALVSYEQVIIPTDFEDVDISVEQLESLLNDSKQAAKQNISVDTLYDLSPMQKGMLFHSQLMPNSGTYIEHTLLHVDDPTFEPSRFIEAMQQVINHHDSLRAAFHFEQGNYPVQMILSQAPLPVTVLDWQILSTEAYPAHLETLIAQDRQTDFDFAQAPLLRLTVVELGSRYEHRYDLLFTFHHILMDRWSVDLFWLAVQRVYAGVLLPPTTSYQTYIHHLRQQAVDAEFWQDYLAGFYAPTPLPGITATVQIRTERQTEVQIAILMQPFSSDESQQITDFARSQGLTLNTLFQATWAVLLARYTNEFDVLFGMVTSGRTAPIQGIESILGLFINTLPFRVQLEGKPTCMELLHQVAQTQLDLQQREHTPLVEVQRWSDLPAGTNLFETLLLFQNTPQTADDAPQLPFRHGRVEPGDAGYPLVALIAPSSADHPTTMMISYDTSCYNADTIQRILTHWQQLVMGVVNQPEQPIHQLPMLTDAEYHQIVHEWNDTAVDFGEPQTIHALFEQQVERTPDAVAVVFEDEQLTYRELNIRANQLAHRLIELDVRADILVAVAMERSLEMVVSLLAVLKAGGAYVPIDPTYPEERIRFMLTDSAASILLTQSHLSLVQMAEDDGMADSTSQPIHVLAIDRIATKLIAQSTDDPQTQTSTNDLAYVIYTSGSTGQPKGVLIPHKAIHNVTLAHINKYNIEPKSQIFQIVSFNFDVATADIFMTLCAGASLRLLSPKVLLFGDMLLRQLQSHKITHMQLSVSVLSSVPFEKLLYLQTIISGGEIFPASLAERWSSNYHVFNAYGPTETTICATAMYCNQNTLISTNPPIGRPLENVFVYILDLEMQPTPICVAGELYIGGTQLAREYLNRPELTAERFIDHPEFGRLYKTGDLCRWLPDGNIEYIGRTDFQVKIRGFRIELGEIENALLAQEGVREAVVIAREENGNKRLVAYIVQSCKVAELQSEERDPATLRQVLGQQLPDYMIPAAFVFLDAMPLTPNGKLDRRALPAPEYMDATQTHVPAETFDETRLVIVWQEVLGVQPIGVMDNFFELGGHSLLATQLVQRMRQTLQCEISLRQLFSTPTIRGLLQSIDDRDAETTSFVPLRIGEETRSPFFIVHAVSGVVFPFATLLAYLPTAQPIYGLQARGIYDDLPLFESLEALAAQSIEEMKRIQPHGPYTIGGWSFGGMVAFEVAHQLRQQGDEIAFLGIIDTYPSMDDQTAIEEEPTIQEELQEFFYLLGDIMNVDYRSLDDDFFEQAAQQSEPVEWLLDTMDEQDIPPAMDSAIIKRIWVTLKRNSQLMQAYQPQPYDGSITLFCAEESAPEEGPQRWQALTPQFVETVWVSGEHQTMLNVEHVERLGRALAVRLEAVGQPLGDGK